MFRLHAVLEVVLLLMLLSEISFGKVAAKTIEKVTSDWEILVKDLKGKLSSEVNPCTDFYSYVCRKHNDTESNDFKNTLILEPYLKKGEGLSEPELKAKHYMHSCLHKTEEDIGKFVKKFNFGKSIGGWPAFDPKWNSGHFDWQASLSEFASYNIWSPIDVSIINSEFDNLTKYLYVRVKPRYFYLFSNGNTQAQFLLNKTLEKVGVKDINEVLNDARQFENVYKAADIDIAWGSPSVLSNFSSLKYRIPELDWDKYLRTTKGRKLPDDFTVKLVKGDVLKRALTTLSKIDPKVFANYLFCRLVYDLPFNEIQLIKEDCWARTYDSFRTALSHRILNTFVSQQVRETVLSALQAYLDTLYKYLPPPETTEDMVKPTYLKQIIEDYLASLTDDNLTREYKDLVIDPGSYLHNFYTMRRYSILKYFEKRWNNELQQATHIEEQIAKNFAYQINRVNTNLWTSVYSYIVFHYFSVRFHLQILNRHLSNRLPRCFDEAMHIKSVKDAINLQILIKSVNDWETKNKQLIQSDNHLLKKNGLSLQKALFIGVMQFWCGENEYIANSIFPKVKEFGDAFNCPIGTPMNPHEKCNIDQFKILA